MISAMRSIQAASGAGDCTPDVRLLEARAAPCIRPDGRRRRLVTGPLVRGRPETRASKRPGAREK
jgi:hypothetical protein